MCRRRHQSRSGTAWGRRLNNIGADAARLQLSERIKKPAKCESDSPIRSSVAAEDVVYDLRRFKKYYLGTRLR